MNHKRIQKAFHIYLLCDVLLWLQYIEFVKNMKSNPFAEIENVCDIISLLATFDQCNASLLKK